jgi:hypothetical protein
MYANAPIGGVGCFWMSGGAGGFPFRRGTNFSVVVESGGDTTDHIPGFNNPGLSLFYGRGELRLRFITFGFSSLGKLCSMECRQISCGFLVAGTIREHRESSVFSYLADTSKEVTLERREKLVSKSLILSGGQRRDRTADAGLFRAALYH